MWTQNSLLLTDFYDEESDNISANESKSPQLTQCRDRTLSTNGSTFFSCITSQDLVGNGSSSSGVSDDSYASTWSAAVSSTSCSIQCSLLAPAAYQDSPESGSPTSGSPKSGSSGSPVDSLFDSGDEYCEDYDLGHDLQEVNMSVAPPAAYRDSPVKDQPTTATTPTVLESDYSFDPETDVPVSASSESDQQSEISVEERENEELKRKYKPMDNGLTSSCGPTSMKRGRSNGITTQHKVIVQDTSDSGNVVSNDRRIVAVPRAEKIEWTTVCGIPWKFCGNSVGPMTKEEAEEVFKCMLWKEKERYVSPNFLEGNDERGLVTSEQRRLVILNMIRFRGSTMFTLETLHLAVLIFDRCLDSFAARSVIAGDIASIALVLASKLEEYSPLRFNAQLSSSGLTGSDVTTLRSLEAKVLDLLDFRLMLPTSFTMSNYLHTVLGSNKRQVMLTNYLLELSLIDDEIRQWRSIQCAGAAVALAHAALSTSGAVNDMALGKSLDSMEAILPRTKLLMPAVKLAELVVQAMLEEHEIFRIYARDDRLRVSHVYVPSPEM